MFHTFIHFIVLFWQFNLAKGLLNWNPTILVIWCAWDLSFTSLISCLLQIYPAITFKCGDEDLFYMAQRFPQKPDRLIFSCGFHKIFCSIWQNWIQLFTQNENTFNNQYSALIPYWNQSDWNQVTWHSIPAMHQFNEQHHHQARSNPSCPISGTMLLLEPKLSQL